MGKIEEAIKQSEFKDSYNKVVVNLLYTHSYLVNFQTAVLKPMDLSPEQYNVLRILRGHQGKPATIAAIQERMLNTMSNASRLVDKLKIKGLVKREECPENRRKVDVLITDKGLQLLESLEPQIATANKKAVQLEENEVAHLNNLLDKLRG
ncbi:MAG: MarR family transcriptional regulator [Algoriphagus sp.]|uniref:MarR family winged helix-turn-helix transcriptional regulator n=1 Tax=Algoriphagus sp. TaxID=1872435 RepID=UPI002748565E|nr:MarR family transcriptional regulator [Algoriphagus sp.]